MIHARATQGRVARGRTIIGNFVVAAALAGAAISQGCGRIGYEPLIPKVGDDGGVGANDAQLNDGATSLDVDTMQVRNGEFFSGQYVGTGMAGLKVTGVGFAPDVVLVHARTKSPSLFATRLMPLGRTRMLSDFNATASANIVTSFGDDGFELGAMTANVSDVVGDYVALKATPGSVAIGRFVGDGQARILTGLGLLRATSLSRAMVALRCTVAARWTQQFT